MTYKISGVDISIEPTSGRWLPREQVGLDGNGKPVYSPYRRFEITWSLITPAQYSELIGYFDNLAVTGSLIVDLPKFDNPSTYAFTSYTGCFVQEPEAGLYFSEHQTSVRLLVTHIRTE